MITPNSSTTSTRTTASTPSTAPTITPSTSISSSASFNDRKRKQPTIDPPKKRLYAVRVLIPPPPPGLPPCPSRFKKTKKNTKPAQTPNPVGRDLSPTRVPVDEPAQDPDFIPSANEEEEEEAQSEPECTGRKRYTGPDDPTAVLPLIYERFKVYFDCLKPVSNDSLDSIHHRNPLSTTPQSSFRFDTHLDQDEIHWTASRPWKVSQNGEDFYQAVKIRSHSIKVDFVVCCLRKTGCERFLVRALFERDQVKYFHGTWLQKACHSFVGASAETLELLLVDECDEIALTQVIGIDKVVWIASDKAEPPPQDTFYCRFHWKPTNASFVDLPCVRKPNPPNPITSSQSLCSTCVAVPKEIEWLTDPTTGEILLGKTDQYESLGFVLRGSETYRLNDFVRVSDPSSSKPQLIGQIVEICGIRANPNADKTIILDDAPFRPPPEVYSKLASLRRPVITIRKYQRKPWFGTEINSNGFLDDRRLWITNHEHLVDVRNQLQGHCEIIHLAKDNDSQYLTLGSAHNVSEDSIVERDNCFYSILPTRRQQKYNCSVPDIDDSWKASLRSREPEWVQIESESQEEQYKDLVKDYGCGKIRHLELFGGIGSMSVALIELGLTSQDETTFIDFSIPACQTLSTNFPRSTVICADVNEVFELMITGKTDTGRDFLVDRRTGKIVHVNQLPRPGDFDLITAGFPCGSHSTLNVLRRANDSKNALCATALSFIAYLKPDYLFFENVRGLLKTRFINPSDDSVLDKAFLRIICGTLITLGYQVRFGVLQAVQFGSPQARRRIIFAGTRHGLTSVKLPEPTHHFPDESLAILLPTNDKPSETDNQNLIRADYRRSTSGALRATTVHDAIADLPAFEYINPNRIMGREGLMRSRDYHDHEYDDDDDDDQESVGGRSELIPQLNSLVSFSPILSESRILMIGFDEFEYVSKPMNRYQLWLRKPLEWTPLVDTFIPKNPRMNGGSMVQSSRHQDHVDDETGSDCRIRNWHVTPKFSSKITERICHIPLKPHADYRHLPKPLRLKNLNRCKNPRDFDGNYGRLGFQDQFNTVITRMHPQNQNKCGTILHPKQNRTLSLLEAQRAQGFPDRYKLEPAASKRKVDETVNEQLFKLVGNSIPIQISMSLSKSLLKAREEDYMKSKRYKIKTESIKVEDIPPKELDEKLTQGKGKQRQRQDHEDEEMIEINRANRKLTPVTSTISQKNLNIPDIMNPHNTVDQFDYLRTCIDCLDLVDLYIDQLRSSTSSHSS
ncbi:hypothetical protein PSTG_07335 [Puccinia striiformis f. sp. tritici PST-78]|uniref:DNA (cytosine-5-)-methyltransferase n=1 Tax=Puccinia striiformis f. sp. tritici PST-78 TaxID=1165861 RepID=A0A0L0VJF4_9BASI|nr:hypothetical protein PSTG_07335 [Puccinia striiformis f. sp. tritici PST-78]